MSMRESRRLRRESRKAALRTPAESPSPLAPKGRSLPRRALFVSATLAILSAMFLAQPNHAQAGFHAPEIDPGSMAGAMTLLVGGVLALTGRSRRA